MKHLLLISLTALTCHSHGQNVLFLKSGEKLNGKVEKFAKDTLTFTFKGNKMQFKSSEIISVYFDEKKIPSEEVPKKTEVVEVKQEGKITGVVTFYFNRNYGDKPDVGAEILIINSTNVPDFHLETVDSFRYASSYKSLYNSYASRGAVPSDITANVKAYGVDTEQGYDAFDKRVGNELNKIRFTNIIYCTKVVVDGNGTYSASLPPGNYYVYITSNNRKGNSMTEIMGKIYCKEVTVKSGGTSNVNANFDQY